MLKAGIMGIGGTIGKSHKRVYNKLAEENGFVKLEACFDVSQDKFGERINIG